MYHRTISEFFKHEISEMHKNIDRIQHHLAGRDTDDKTLAGQFVILAEQQNHLQFLEQLQAQATTYEDAIAICRQHIIANEQAHSEIASREDEYNPVHSPGWWQTLHDSQFASDVMHRIQSWRQTYGS